MIIKGKSRSGPGALAAHLGNAEKNERVRLLETRGTVAQDLRGALVEMDAYALGTKCDRPLYHAAISPGPPHRLSEEQRAEAIDALEEKLGFSGHARVVMLHEKLGREHIHVVWSRIDLDRMRAVSDSHNYRKHEEVARDLERRFGHERVQGAHHERDGVERPDRTPSRAELRQEERTGISGKAIKADVTALFRQSDGPDAFQASLQDRGYILAQGDKRDFVIVDQAGGIHSLARRIDGIKAAELREFMSPIDRSILPTAEEAKAFALDRQQRFHDLSESREDDALEKAYGRGDGYVSQTTAALKDFQRRQDELNKEADAIRLFDYGEPIERKIDVLFEGNGDSNAVEHVKSKDEEERFQKDRDRQNDAQIARGQGEPYGKSTGSFQPAQDQITDRMARLLGAAMESDREREQDTDDWSPDRQHEAPGGGRTRSR